MKVQKIGRYTTISFEKIDHLNEEIIEGDKLVLTINLHPDDFNVRRSMVETMNMFQLNDYIKKNV